MKEVTLALERNDAMNELRNSAAQGETQLRALHDLEMGWVAGGDGQPVWPY